MVTRKTSFIYISLLVIAILLAMPCMKAHAQQATDINKPTRERVKDKKDATATKKQESKPAEKQPVKPAEKQPAKPAEKQQTKPAEKQPVKPADNQPVKPAEKQDNANPAADTAAKAAAAQPKVRKTVNTSTADFDGIDVSRHQGRINWDELRKNPKIKFVYIKATEGSDYIDPTYLENIRNARKSGFKVGSYHFLSTRSSVVTQFINFARTVKREEQDLLPVIDVEKIKPWSSQQLRDSLKVFADLVEEYYGCKPIIYTSEKFFTSNLGRAFKDYPLFIAKYSDNQPNIGYKWIIWQFADNGLFKTSAVKGNNGLVDLSRFNKGCTVNDLIYRPVKGKPKISVMDAVDKKEKPATINLTEQSKTKDVAKPTAKQQKEEEQKKVEKAKRASEREKRLAEEEAKKKAKEKAEADKKAKSKAEQEKREKARQQAKEQKAKEEAAAKQRKAAEQKAKVEAERKAAEQKAKADAEAKAKRKAAAQQAKQEKTQQKASSGKQNKSASLLGTSSSKMSQAQQGDSIRNARYQGRKTNKSSADND